MTTSRFEISRQTHTASYSMHTAHQHSYYEMYYLINGSCRFMLQGKEFLINSGTIVFIPANALHKTTYTDGSSHERLYAEFTGDYIDDLLAQFGTDWLESHLFNFFFYIPIELRPEINNYLSLIINERRSSDNFSFLMTKQLFQTLIIKLLRHKSTLANYHGISLQSGDSALSEAMNYIASNFQNNISLTDIAGRLHLNPSYLSQKFKAVNGISFKEYINTIRINHAEKLLLETNKSITEIALECGYETSNYFGDVFKKTNGISPSQFRKIKGNVEG